MLCYAFFLTGCATIMSHGPQTLPILTQPDGAECEITDADVGKSIAKAKTPHTAALPRPAETAGAAVRVILPGSKGLNLRRNNEEFFVENVFYSPNYRGPPTGGTVAKRPPDRIGTSRRSSPSIP